MVVVAPRMFKHLVGHGHSEFSSGRQQDAAEYMQHLLEVISVVCCSWSRRFRLAIPSYVCPPPRYSRRG